MRSGAETQVLTVFGNEPWRLVIRFYSYENQLQKRSVSIRTSLRLYFESIVHVSHYTARIIPHCTLRQYLLLEPWHPWHLPPQLPQAINPSIPYSQGKISRKSACIVKGHMSIR